jgi:hypothetical protein
MKARFKNAFGRIPFLAVEAKSKNQNMKLMIIF